MLFKTTQYSFVAIFPFRRHYELEFIMFSKFGKIHGISEENPKVINNVKISCVYQMICNSMWQNMLKDYQETNDAKNLDSLP